MVLPEGASRAVAQEVSIKVLVNDDPISDYDIDQRKRFLAITTQQQPSPDLKKQAIDLLIDERLQMQQARKLGVTADDDDMSKILGDMAQKNNLDRGRTYHGARQGRRQHQDAEGPHPRAARLASGRCGRSSAMTSQIGDADVDNAWRMPERVPARKAPPPAQPPRCSSGK